MERRYIRHPVDIPIEVSTANEFAHARGDNISPGGLALRHRHELESGIIVRLRIPFVQPTFEANARVAWCRKCDEGYELGVQFLGADDAFRARMVEQVCSIESYRRNISRIEQRDLSAQEAALEWIQKYASEFPGAAGQDVH